MSGRTPISPRCFFTAWISAWVAAIYVPSALIVAARLSPLADGRSFPAALFAVADEVAPAAKIAFPIASGLLLFLARRLVRMPGLTRAITDMVLALLAMVLILALLPEHWSRGFGLGLGGERFAAAATIIYLSGAALAGLVFSLSEAACRARSFRAQSNAR